MIKILGSRFKDEHGRTLLLRGVNLGGSSKVPMDPNGASWNKDGFYDHRQVSFVGRPFPLVEADEHFGRLRAWGFTLLRFLVTWEAIEHSGPGEYDEAYLDYLYAVLAKAQAYDFSIFIDPHQDTWSRFTGGDGAPGWTLEAVGFDLSKLHAAGAAILHQEHGDPFPRMIWVTNYNKLAAATMFTLFFAGDDFAPQLTVNGTPIQEYLQSHYFNAIKQVVRRLKGLPSVIGYETLNEPSNGFIGEKDASQPAQGIPAMIGETPTIFEGMLLGSDYPQAVDVYKIGLTGFVKTGKVTANPQGVSAWMPGRQDIWRQHGVWEVNGEGKPVLKQPGYFAEVRGRPVDFHEDYFKPFANRFAREIRSIAPQAIIFVAGAPHSGRLTWGGEDAENIVHAPHWYDGMTLLRKSFLPWLTVHPDTRKVYLGAKRVQACLTGQIADLLRHSAAEMGNAPTLIGEVGIPFDMQGKKAYRSGIFTMQERALNATMRALEQNFASFALWNYTADNTNQYGDLWNDEDLSLFSRDQMTGSGSIHDGGRALRAAIRPYACKVAGEPVQTAFDYRKSIYEFSFRQHESVAAPTEIYLPEIHYAGGFEVEVSDGDFAWDGDRQILTYRHTQGQTVHRIKIKAKKLREQAGSALFYVRGDDGIRCAPASQPGGAPGVLEVESAGESINIQDFPSKEQPVNQPALHRLEIHLVQADAATGDKFIFEDTLAGDRKFGTGELTGESPQAGFGDVSPVGVFGDARCLKQALPQAFGQLGVGRMNRGSLAGAGRLAFVRLQLVDYLVERARRKPIDPYDSPVAALEQPAGSPGR